ncbi:MAG: hypothetical protein SHS37scaffold537_8 [Phage 68_12]|nr:MAG: hypothetical protein SHS37scaffold537_8 [Phage 68_12]
MPALVRVLGRARLQRTLRQAGVEMADFKETNTALAADAAALVAAEAPKRSGRLAGDVRGSKAKTKISVLAGRKRLPYAGPINWGWPGRPNASRGWRGGPIAANNFLKRGAEQAMPVVLHGWESHLQNELNKVKGI